MNFSQPTQNAFELRNVAMHYGSRTALSLEQLSVRSGGRLGIIGPNGAGKSTLLRVIGLIAEPREGSLRLLGTRVWPPDPSLELRRRLAMVFQNPLLLDMSVYENVAVGLRIRGLTACTIRERTERWLRKFGVWELRRRGIHGLSGGEAQRVSLARAFALEPELMLMDEPFASLDLPTRQRLLVDVRDALDATGTTSVLVTHDFYEVSGLCEEVLVLIDGQPVAFGAPDALLSSTDNPAVNSFLAPWKELSNWSARRIARLASE